MGYRGFWHNGVAQVHCDVKASCSSCASRAGCGSRVLNKLGPQTSHTISVPCEQPLAAGQKWSWGSLKAACWAQRCWCIWRRWRAVCNGVYFQVLFASDIASLCGALLGGVGGFGGARSVAATGGTSVPAAGDFERRTAAGSAAC